MEIKEAIRILHPDTTAEALVVYVKEEAMKIVEEACVVACEALEKQIPKKPIKTQDIEGITDFYCSECSRIVGCDTYKFLYCPKCGQAIDWKVEE